MKRNRLAELVNELLFREWDPIGLNKDERCRDEYRSYATMIAQLLLSGADECKLTSRLESFERGSMGLSANDDDDEDRRRQVARKLLELTIGRR